MHIIIIIRVNLAKALIGGFSSTASLGHSAKHRKIENLSVAPENMGKHFIWKIEGRKRVCVHCKRVGRKTRRGRSVETTFQCLHGSVALCKTCFHEYHMVETGILTRVLIRDAEMRERSVSFKCIYDHNLITFWPFNSLFGLYLRSFCKITFVWVIAWGQVKLRINITHVFRN